MFASMNEDVYDCDTWPAFGDGLALRIALRGDTPPPPASRVAGSGGANGGQAGGGRPRRLSEWVGR